MPNSSQLVEFLDHVAYSCYMLLFFNSKFHCGIMLTVHKNYLKILTVVTVPLWNNRNGVTVERC